MQNEVFPLDINSQLGLKIEGLRFLLLGTCAVGPLADTALDNGIQVDHLLWESHAHSDTAINTEKNYDANVISLTLRHIYMGASLKMGYGSINDLVWPRLVLTNGINEYFECCVKLIEDRIKTLLPIIEKRNTFFLSFLEPRQNYLGILFPRYELSNPAYFVQQLNEKLASLISQYKNAFFLDANEIVSTVGSMHVRDDYTSHLAHSSYISDWDVALDHNRLQKSTNLTSMYRVAENINNYGYHFWLRLTNSLKILEQKQIVKLIITDLDDTIWRGVAADEDNQDNGIFTEGWPLAYAEALLIFKARGGMLAICSKNDSEATLKRFREIYADRITLEDFVSIKINFNRKSENIAAILSEVNVLPENTLFIDDNPREIDEVTTVYPSLRTLSSDHYDWRRKILFSAETQVAGVTKESSNRTDLIKAKIHRDTNSKGTDRNEWLRSLKLEQNYSLINSLVHPSFSRANELINKTNQFNTTGQKWSSVELAEFFATGGYLVCSFLRDRTIENGLISVVLIKNNLIVQMVLSCRVFGLSSEYATGRVVANLILKNHDSILGNIVDTGKNFTCHGYFKSMQFTDKGKGVFISERAPVHPAFILNKSNDARADTSNLELLLNSVLDGNTRPTTLDAFLRYSAADLIYTQVGCLSGDSMNTTGRSGFLCYGPYVDLPAGSYRICFSGDSMHWMGAETMDICGDEGGEIFLRELLDIKETGPWSAQFAFNLKKSHSRIEFRIFVDSKTQISLNNIEITLF